MDQLPSLSSYSWEDGGKKTNNYLKAKFLTKYFFFYFHHPGYWVAAQGRKSVNGKNTLPEKIGFKSTQIGDVTIYILCT